MVVLYIGIVVLVMFLLSNVVPRYRSVRARRARVEAFREKYREWHLLDGRIIDGEDYIGQVIPDGAAQESDEAAKAAEPLRVWLMARRDEMQADAQAAGRGISMIAPAPAVGGPIVPYAYFADLFDAQTYAAEASPERLDELATILHETERQERRLRHDLLNPWAWFRLGFERLVAFPAYVLRTAGFSEDTASSAATRVVGIVWSFVVGAATIYPVVAPVLR